MANSDLVPPQEVVQLCSPLLDMDSFISLCQTSKDLHAHGISTFIANEPFAKQLLARAAKEMKQGRPGQDPRTLFKVSWLLKQGIKAWGLIPLSTHLDLQGALISFGRHDLLADRFISAGARLSAELAVSAAFNPTCSSSPLSWVQLTQEQGLASGLPPVKLPPEAQQEAAAPPLPK